MIDPADKEAIVTELESKLLTDFCNAIEPQVDHLSWPVSNMAPQARAAIAGLRKRAADLLKGPTP